MSKPYPAEYLCCDPGSFAANTLAVRLPEIARRVLIENQYPSPIIGRVDSLLEEMRFGYVQPLGDPGAPDSADWDGYLQTYLGRKWPQLSFLACENLFYRRILAATGYFQNGLEHGLDPYAKQKQLGLETSRGPLGQISARLEAWRECPIKQAVYEALETNLWGNRADLSLWPAGAEGTLSNDQLHQAEEFLLVNEIQRLSMFLAEMQEGRVDLLIDNAGFELGCDLALADLVLANGRAREVRLHVKFHPTFVSDALVEDVRRTVLFFGELNLGAASALSRRLVEAIENGRLIIHNHRFWNSPLPGWQLPEDLRTELSGADLVISKGDAHFRRLVGDRRWAGTTPFSRITEYFPTRLAALRVDKSEVAVNLRPGQEDELDKREPDWRTSGRWGMIQFA